MDLLTDEQMKRLEYKSKNNLDLREKYEDYKIFIEWIERMENRIQNSSNMDKAVNDEYDLYIAFIGEVENILPILKKYAEEKKREFEI